MKRKIFDFLLQWKNKEGRKPLIVKGARQVGKTYIIQSFGKAHFPNVHYINFEKDARLIQIFDKDLNPGRILQELSFHFNRSIDKNNDLVVFDEIQDAPRALTALKYFCEESPELAICAAGSLLGVHLSSVSFPVGKVEFLHMSPMSFREFLQGIGDHRAFEFLRGFKMGDEIPNVIHEHLWERLKIYFIVGGLPEAVKVFAQYQDDLFEALQKVREKQDNIILAYNADMAKHSGKQNAMHIERLWKNVPAQLAKEQNGSAAKFKFKDVIPGVKRYSGLVDGIDWLKAAGLIYKVNIVNSGQIPFSAYTIENSFKLCVFDVGILGALSGLPPKAILDYDYGTYKGYFAENFAAQEFVCSGIRELYCWRKRTAEVEFLREWNGEVIPIEIKSGWVTNSKSLRVFVDKYHPKYSAVVSAKKFFFDKTKQVLHCPLYLISLIHNNSPR